MVGVAGGATRAAIAVHQARRDNAAEVAAKDGSQVRGRDWEGLGYTGRVWEGLVSAGLYWSVLVYSGLQWFILVCTGLYWSLLVYTGQETVVNALGLLLALLLLPVLEGRPW